MARRSGKERAGEGGAAGGAAVEPNARERLLDTAERLFAEQGFNGVATRQISQEAKVNQGAIPYYFGTKINLLREVLVRRIGPVQEERHRRMDELLRANPRPSPRDVLLALLEPAFRQSHRNVHYRRLAGRMATDASAQVRGLLHELYSSDSVRIHKVLRAACPGLDTTDFYWRLYCVYGVMLYVQADTGKIQTLAGKDFDTSRPEVALRYVLNFVTAGMEAPPPGG